MRSFGSVACRLRPVPVAPSPEHGYRMRARFHVAGTRVGFYREGSHTLCDAAVTGQVGDPARGSVASAVEVLAGAGARIESVELTESVDACRRALSITVDDVRVVGADVVASLPAISGLVGCVVRDATGGRLEAGEPRVTDSLGTLTRGRVPDGELRRHAESFFQANRFLVPELMTAVLDAVVGDGPVLDLYAGVGFFSVALAGAGRRDITAVEGDPTSGADLAKNAGSLATPGTSRPSSTVSSASLHHWGPHRGLQPRPSSSIRLARGFRAKR